MTIAQATKLRDEYIKTLVGRFYDSQRPDWTIKDIIVSDKENAGNVYTKMFKENMSNEKALSLFSINENDYDALIVAHQFPWGGDLLVESVQNYLKTNITDFSPSDDPS